MKQAKIKSLIEVFNSRLVQKTELDINPHFGGKVPNVPQLGGAP